LPLEEARAAELRKADQAHALSEPTTSLESLLALNDDDLDALSNSAVDLANDGQFDQALAACARLLSEFPEVVDGLERSAMVHAKMGHHALAADLYRQAFDFVNHPSRCNDYEDRDSYRQQAEKQQRLADSL